MILELEQQKAKLINSLPTRADIFLPTAKIDLKEQIIGLKHVKRIYETDLEKVYNPRLRALKNGMSHKKRCFIIGNGPSLNNTDLSLLKNEVTFAVNGFFLKSQELDWTPTFYIVEDHLVAEDRQSEIINFKGPIKLFPAYLGYCIPAAEDTIFYNHRPRKSYPDGFDFSIDADKVTYAGCTVTFSAMQIAAYFGFEEIYLVGVDASYEIPKDAKNDRSYGTSILDMSSDDINHFHPDYFGKGYRWHDPQVNKMIEAYNEAKKVTASKGINIYNATIGGKLEVFPRREYIDLFPNIIPSENSKLKLLLIDFTRIGNGTATGELKRKYLNQIPPGNLFHVYGEGKKEQISYFHNGVIEENISSYKKLLQDIREFDPDIILYRPVAENLNLHSTAKQLITALKKPFIIWLMDDWPARLRKQDNVKSRLMETDLSTLCQAAIYNFSICEAMSGAFGARYGALFKVFRNGIQPKDINNKIDISEDDIVIIRYAGALSDDMTRSSVEEIAKTVEELGSIDYKIRFEILTNIRWRNALNEILEGKIHVFGSHETLSYDKYKTWLNSADILIITNNFAPDSQIYLKYSWANKIPECLGSDAAVLGYGPSENATIHYLHSSPGTLCVTQEGTKPLSDALIKLLSNTKLRQELSDKGRDFARKKLDINKFTVEFHEILSKASQKKYRPPNFAVELPQLTKAPIMQKEFKSAVKRYILGWKGIAGVLSIVIMGIALLLGFTSSNVITTLIAASLGMFSQSILFLLLLHLAAHMNTHL